MNDIEKALNQIEPTIVIYGEPWAEAETPLPDSEMSVTVNMWKLNVGSFADDSRECYKHWITGDRHSAERAAKIRYGLAGATAIDGAAARLNSNQCIMSLGESLIMYRFMTEIL